jgi:hypothetical protein
MAARVFVFRINPCKRDLNVSDLNITLFSDRFGKHNVSNRCLYIVFMLTWYWFLTTCNCVRLGKLLFSVREFSLGYSRVVYRNNR